MAISTQSAVEDPALLQLRLRRFSVAALVATLLCGLILAITTWLSRGGDVAPAAIVIALGGGAPFAVVWLSVWRGERSMTALHHADSFGPLAAAAIVAGAMWSLPASEQPAYWFVLLLSCVLILRSLVIPSTTPRTLWIAGFATLPLLVLGIYREAPIVSLIFVACWWSVSVALSTTASHVVYGLRRQIHRASRLGPYTLERKLGEGGMGIVYRARHQLLKRRTAVKVLRPDHCTDHDIARFEREVQLTATLTHPNTVQVFDYGRTPDGLFFYAMELIDGMSLLDVVTADGPQPPSRVAHILCQIAGSLSEAHSAGLIHRDIKPANVLLCQQGGEPDVAKVVDFGLVKELDTDTRALTADNTLVGTPMYMAPEAIRDPHAVDHRSDLYALGCVAYFLLTASDVFERDSVVAVCSDHLHLEPERAAERLGAAIPEELEMLVMDCLAKSPDDRPDTAQAFRERLAPVIAEHPWRREDAQAWWARHGPAAPASLPPWVNDSRLRLAAGTEASPKQRATPVARRRKHAHQ